MADCYYLDGARNQQGPVATDEIARLIRGGRIRRDTLVWYAGMPDWSPAGQVGEFASLFAQAAPAAPAPRPLGGAAPSQHTGSMAGAYAGQYRQARAGGDVEPRMGFGGAISTCFSRYVGFTGRARRKEYWFWHLFFYLALIGALAVDGGIAAVHGPAVFTLLAYLALLLPSLAVAVRRLHDTDHSGWMMLITFIPLVGPIVFIVFMCQRGTSGSNRFGPDPLGQDIAAAFD